MNESSSDVMGAAYDRFDEWCSRFIAAMPVGAVDDWSVIDLINVYDASRRAWQIGDPVAAFEHTAPLDWREEAR